MAAPSKLKLARLRAGLLQRQLGKRLGVTHATISMWESGVLLITPEQRQRFLAACQK